MKKLTFALAVASALAVFAEGDGVLNSIGFEDYTAGFSGLSLKSDAGVEGAPSESYWLGSAEDASTVKAYSTDGVDSLIAPVGNMLSGELGNNYLELSTEGGTLWRSINTLTDAETLGDAVNIVDDTDSGELYIDTMVQFTPTEDGGDPEVAAADRLAIWLNVDSSGEKPVTNLCVRAGYIDDQAGVTPTTYVIQNASVDAGSWYRLTVKAVPDITAGDEIPGFIIYLDSTKLVADKMTLDEAYTESDDLDGELADCAVFASLLGSGDPTVQGVGFKGSGALDDLVFTTENPLPEPAGDVEFTIAAATGVTVEWSKDNGTTWTEGTSCAAPADGSIQVRLTNGDGAVKTVTKLVSAVADGTLDVADETFGWPEYLGDAIDGAYEIDSLAELQLFQKGVTAGLATAGETFKQTVDIDMASAGAWDGIGGNGKDTAPFFQGTYDGNGKTISNLTLARAKYRGFFDSVKNATIKDLTISVAGIEAGDSEAGFAAFVGSASGSTLLQRLTANGTIGTSTAYSKHTTAGIAVSFCGVIDCCTNNATIFAAIDNTKLGGMVGIAQGGASIYSNCVNTAALTANQNGGYVEGVGGIVGYNASPITLVNCVNTGVITDETNAGVAGNLVGEPNADVTGVGVNKGLSSGVACGTKKGGTITGFELVKVVDAVAEYYAGLAGSGTEEAPFVVATANDLETLRFGVDLGAYGQVGQFFQQTADIDMEGVDAAFAGIGTYDEGGKGTKVFESTYDGNGKTISNLKLVAAKYTALFNQVSGTVKNLTVQNVSYAEGATFGGAMVVCNLVGGTVENVTTKGTFGTAERPLTHNAAGVVCRAGAGVIRACTNQAAIVGSYTKLAGILVIQQNKTGVVDADGNAALLIEDCSNEGSVTAMSGTDAGRDGIGGIFAYSGNAGVVTIKNCSNSGAIVAGANSSAAAKVGQLLGYYYTAVTFDGVNTGTTDALMIGGYNSNNSGCNFATVDGTVATLVADTAVAAGSTYLVAAPVSTFAFEFAAAGTIAFDNALYPTFAAEVTAAGGLAVSSTTAGTVTTYTAGAPAPAWPTDEGWAQDADVDVKAKFADWKADYVGTFENQAEAFLMGVAPGGTVPDLKIESITVDGTTATVVVSAAGVELDKINGVLYVESSNDLANWTVAQYDVATTGTVGTDGKATFTVTAGKFMKAKIGFKVPVQQ